MKTKVVFGIFTNLLIHSFFPICDAVFTTYDGPISGKKTISDCVNGSRKSYSDLEISTSEQIKQEGYPAEEHFLVTDDGYLLTVHRIPGAPGSPVALIQHGGILTSFDFVASGKDAALAFYLSDQGYDVWLGNSRGNFYSRCHATIDPSDRKFWDFSYHEMGIYDLPATINYIKNVTAEEKIIYIGHSIGTAEFFIMASELPEYTGDNVKAMFCMAPAVFNYYLRGSIAMTAPFIRLFTILNNHRADYEAFTNSQIWKLFVKYFCSKISNEICEVLVFTLTGFDPDLADPSKMPLYLNHFPMGSSIKTFDHIFQSTMTNEFRHYDYGKAENILRYNSNVPPVYDLTKVQVPIGIFHALNDYLSNREDVEHLWSELPNKILKYIVPFDKFNHFDFIWAIKARELVYEKLVAEMKKF